MELAVEVGAINEKIRENAVPSHDIIDNKDSYRNRWRPCQKRKSLKTCKLMYGMVQAARNEKGIEK